MLYSTHGKPQNKKKWQTGERKRKLDNTVIILLILYMPSIIRPRCSTCDSTVATNEPKWGDIMFLSFIFMELDKVCSHPESSRQLLISCSSLQSLGSRGRWSEFTGVGYVLINYDFISNSVFLLLIWIKLCKFLCDGRVKPHHLNCLMTTQTNTWSVWGKDYKFCLTSTVSVWVGTEQPGIVLMSPWKHGEASHLQILKSWFKLHHLLPHRPFHLLTWQLGHKHLIWTWYGFIGLSALSLWH